MFFYFFPVTIFFLNLFNFITSLSPRQFPFFVWIDLLSPFSPQYSFPSLSFPTSPFPSLLSSYFPASLSVSLSSTLHFPVPFHFSLSSTLHFPVPFHFSFHSPPFPSPSHRASANHSVKRRTIAPFRTNNGLRPPDPGGMGGGGG